MSIDTATAETIVRGLSNGKSLQRMAEMTAVPYADVMRIAQANGYPDRAKMSAAADRMGGGAPRPHEGQPTAPAVTSTTLAALFEQAGKVGLGSRVERIKTMIDDLSTAVTEKSELGKAKAELEQAKARLKAAEAKVRSLTGKPSSGRSGPMDGLNAEERRVVRAWSEANGRKVTSPTLPREVVEAYRAAHPESPIGAGQ